MGCLIVVLMVAAIGIALYVKRDAIGRFLADR